VTGRWPATAGDPAFGGERVARAHLLLSQLVSAHRPAVSTVVVAAHPDDETLGAGVLLSRLAEAWVVCITDGGPRDLRAPGRQPAAKATARVRRRELRAALGLAGVGAERVMHLGVAELAASENLPGLVHRLTLLLRGLHPQLVITHAYEGGHPDHDALAFALRVVVDRLQGEQRRAPVLAEMLGYHRQGEEVVVDRFLPASTDSWAVTLRPSPRERRLRREMLASFGSSAPGLAELGGQGRERFRPAPRYDFTQPPHEGRLHYEALGLPLDGRRWRRLAAAAQRELAA
jgi:LmbE family N-acetylglucosaminyl deacetylase